jgi:hypothetical protein
MLLGFAGLPMVAGIVLIGMKVYLSSRTRRIFPRDTSKRHDC